VRKTEKGIEDNVQTAQK